MSNLPQEIRTRVGDVMVDIIVEQIQVYSSICQGLGVPKETLDRAKVEYSVKTMMTGLKLPKARSPALLTDMVRPLPVTRANEHITSVLPFYNSAQRTVQWNIAGNDVPVYSSVQLYDGYFPAVGRPGDAPDVATFAVISDGDRYDCRRLTQEDVLVMDDHGIKYELG